MIAQMIFVVTCFSYSLFHVTSVPCLLHIYIYIYICMEKLHDGCHSLLNYAFVMIYSNYSENGGVINKGRGKG